MIYLYATRRANVPKEALIKSPSPGDEIIALI
jgi:hypothetical protein